MVYPGVRRAELRRELDRETWASVERVISTHDFVVSAETEEIEVDFKAIFEDPPFFQIEIELQEGEVLVEGDYPVVSAGVREWRTTIDELPESEKRPHYMGALVWVTAIAQTAYRIRYRLSFTGVTFKNVSTFRTTNG